MGKQASNNMLQMAVRAGQQELQPQQQFAMPEQGQYAQGTQVYHQQQHAQAPFQGGECDKGKGAQGGEDGIGGTGERTRPLDEPQISRCPMLGGPFAAEEQRIYTRNECRHCKEAGVQAYHSGSWECDVQYWAPRARFNNGEVDRWNRPVPRGMQGLQHLALQQAPPPPPGPPPGLPPAQE